MLRLEETEKSGNGPSVLTSCMQHQGYNYRDAADLTKEVRNLFRRGCTALCVLEYQVNGNNLFMRGYAAVAGLECNQVNGTLFRENCSAVRVLEHQQLNGRKRSMLLLS